MQRHVDVIICFMFNSSTLTQSPLHQKRGKCNNLDEGVSTLRRVSTELCHVAVIVSFLLLAY